MRAIENAFSLGVGKAVNDSLRALFFACNPVQPIVVADFASGIKGVIKSVWPKARKTKNIEKYLKMGWTLLDDPKSQLPMISYLRIRVGISAEVS